MLSAQEFIDYLDRKEIPPDPPIRVRFDVSSYAARREVTERGMWALVYRSWVKILAEWIGDRKVLEVMAGRGWLAKALADEDITIIATDNNSWDDKHTKANPVHQVFEIDAIKAVCEIEADILIISWPPCGDEIATEVLKVWGEGKPIVYIGEGMGGCNAPDSFWQHWRRSSDEIEIPLAKWDGLHDSIKIGYYTATAHHVCCKCGGWAYDNGLCFTCED